MNTEKQSLFLMIPHVIFADGSISANAKFILAEILNLLKVDRRWCWASNEHFARMFALQKTNVSYHIQQLEKQGWIISEVVNECSIEQCQLRERGWHRHIKAGTPLSNILDSLSSPTGYPIKSTRITNITIEKNNEKRLLAGKLQAPAVVKKREPSAFDKILGEVVTHLELTLDTKISNWGKQRKALKMMLDAEYTKEQIIKTITYLEKDEFFRGKGFDLMTVANQIPLVRARERRRYDPAEKVSSRETTGV